MATSTIRTAFDQYVTRPADERYPSVDAMIHAANEDKLLSVERTYNVKDLRAETYAPVGQLKPIVVLKSEKGMAQFTHWSFGQFARSLGAPAGYLRTLPADIAAAALNYGISETSADLNLLVKAPNGNPSPLIRAATSDTYGRVWDAQLYGEAKHVIFDRPSSRDNVSQWMLPPTWSGESAGAYRGDRDSFLIQVDGGSIVENPSRGTATNQTTGAQYDARGRGDRPMYRGLLIRNSEVGASSISIDCVLFDYICGNHMLWGAVIDTAFRRRHVGAKTLRDTIREIGQIAHKWTSHSAERDSQVIAMLMRNEIATTPDAVRDELRKMGATKEQADDAVSACTQFESASPRSYWGIAAGLTRNSQLSGYQDERFALDQLASKVLARGAKVYA